MIREAETMPFPRDEIAATVERYIETRKVIDAGDAGWSALAQYFTDDAVFIDPAWGRVEGIEEMRATVFGDAMVGLEDWKFPVEFYAIEGDNVIIKWKQLLPGQRTDGRPYEQSGVSTLIYAGNGRFRYEEDLLNMVHVLEDMRESKCKVPDVAMPPKHPNRDFSRPNG
ncbi:MAG TPA: nuclear transport factor 2 family protein [Acidimicrobiia bacterium]|nr:nuclear transport factor 2 family protein [Acidimicrobiia bacterium]